MTAALSILGLIVTLHVVGTAGDSATVCPTGWLAYNNYCYLVSQKSTSWFSAQDECAGQDASLLRLYSQAELAWMVQTLVSTPSSGYWTALNDNPKTTGLRLGTLKWKWGYSEYADMSLIQWMQSPANDGTANCAGVNIQGKLADVQCMAKQGYICNLNSDNGCPLGWLPTDSNCYWVSNTSDPTQLLTWGAAKTWCEGSAAGATLLIIDDQNDVNFLTGELPYLTQSTKTHWIGLQYTKNAWDWYKSGTTLDHSLIHWQTEPDNVGGIENCGVMRMSGKFNTRDCTSGAKYICKKPQYSYSPSDNVGCGPWIRAGQYCYNFHASSRATWQDARTACLQSNSDLVKVDSFDKQGWLQVQLMDPSITKAYWTGLTDQQTEGVYVWADGTPYNVSYVIWDQEPNDFKGDEDCAVVFNNGQYNDVICNNKAAAICELENNPSCQAGWVAYGGNCYLFTASNDVSLLYTQSEASAFCATFATNASNIAGLLSVNDQNEKAFILGKLTGLPENVYGWYTSLNDKVSEGFWSFANAVYDSSLVDWKGQPSKRPNDDCGMTMYAGFFHQVDCTNKLGYICERLATGVTAGAVKVNTVYGSLVLLCTALVVLLSD